MEIIFTLNVSDKLYDLLNDKLPDLSKRTRNAVVKTVGKGVRDSIDEVGVRIALSKDQPAEEAEQ